MISRLRKLAVVVLAALALVLTLGHRAYAGTLSVSDRAHVFSASDERRLAAAARDLPFDVRLVTSTAHATRPAFDDEIHQLVTSPSLVVFGVDPEHHFAIVHVGTGTGIAPSQGHGIAEEGAARFKDHDWVGGALAMMSRADSVSSGARGAASPVPVHRSSSGLAGFGALLLLVIGGVIVAAIVIAVVRSRRPEPAYFGGAPMPPPSPPYGGYGYGPQPGPMGGGGGIGSHLGAAALGGLAGYELGKMAGEHEADRERYVERGGFVDDSPRDDGNYDAGGGSADWSNDDDNGIGGGGFDGGSSDGGGGGGSDW